MILKLAIWNICEVQIHKIIHTCKLYIRAYIGKIVEVLIDIILSKNYFLEPNSFMHMSNVSTLYRQHIKLLHQKLW